MIELSNDGAELLSSWIMPLRNISFRIAVTVRWILDSSVLFSLVQDSGVYGGAIFTLKTLIVFPSQLVGIP